MTNMRSASLDHQSQNNPFPLIILHLRHAKKLGNFTHLWDHLWGDWILFFHIMGDGSHHVIHPSLKFSRCGIQWFQWVFRRWFLLRDFRLRLGKLRLEAQDFALVLEEFHQVLQGGWTSDWMNSAMTMMLLQVDERLRIGWVDDSWLINYHCHPLSNRSKHSKILRMEWLGPRMSCGISGHKGLIPSRWPSYHHDLWMLWSLRRLISQNFSVWQSSDENATQTHLRQVCCSKPCVCCSHPQWCFPSHLILKKVCWLKKNNICNENYKS